MLVSVSMSGQGYVSSALARYLIEYFIDTSPVDARITLVQPLGHLELDLVEGAPSAFGNPAIGLELKPREILRVPSPRVARSLLTQQ